MASQGYDFLSDDNAARWKGLFVPYLRMVLAEVHPYLDIEDRALLYLESLLYRLLSKICAIGPLQKQDVKNYVKKNYPNPVNEWAIQEAEDSMDKIMSHKRKSQHGLPLDKIHNQLVKVCTVLYLLVVVRKVMAKWRRREVDSCILIKIHVG